MSDKMKIGIHITEKGRKYCRKVLNELTQPEVIFMMTCLLEIITNFHIEEIEMICKQSPPKNINRVGLNYISELHQLALTLPAIRDVLLTPYIFSPKDIKSEYFEITQEEI